MRLSAVAAARLMACLAASVLVACNRGASADTATPPATSASALPPGVVQLEPPEMNQISVDTVRVRSQRVVATLPHRLPDSRIAQ